MTLYAKWAPAPGGDTIRPIPKIRPGTSLVGVNSLTGNATTTSSVPPRQVKTRRAPATKNRYDAVSQGIRELYHNDRPITTDMDIVFVPGMGADPEDSWRSQSTGFNWVTDKEGLARDFPRARFLLFEPLWMGTLQVKQQIDDLAATLLNSLQGVRPDPRETEPRPVVFVGHSIGGLVIAKAVCLAADLRHESSPKMFENIAGCVFFGTPFSAAPAVEAAAMVAYLGGKPDAAVTSRPLDPMKPDSEYLCRLRNNFLRCVGKLNERIKLYAFFEEKETDLTKLVGLPFFASLFEGTSPESLKRVLVNRDSATLSGIIDSMGMATTHEDLCKFESFKDSRYQAMRDPLRSIIHGAQLVVKRRLNLTRDIDRDVVKSAMDILSGPRMAKKRRALRKAVASSEWVLREPEYVEWLTKTKDGSREHPEQRSGGNKCLWIHGSETRERTGAVLAAIDDIEEMIRAHDVRCSGEAPITLAYFFCDSSPGSSNAESLLKSLVRQLIATQERLAKYAKKFLTKGSSWIQSTMTVENLCQTLQHMLNNEVVGSRIYFVIGNLHALPDNDATKRLMSLLHSSLADVNNGETTCRVPIRWLLTSRMSAAIKTAVSLSSTAVIDLEADKYSTRVSRTNRHYAHARIRDLAGRKKYSKALAYFATSLISTRAPNIEWIDIACARLDHLRTNNDLHVRRVLEDMPQDLKGLLDQSWAQILQTEVAFADHINEILRVMLLTFEDPTVEELEILSGFGGHSVHEDGAVGLLGLVDKCKPFIQLKGKRKCRTKTKVGFMTEQVKQYFLEGAEELLGLTQEDLQRQHGVISLRSFSHIMDCNWAEKTGDSQVSSEMESSDDDVDKESQITGLGDCVVGDWDSDDVDDDGDEMEPKHANQPPAPGQFCEPHPYMIKHWIHHASIATADIAEELSLGTEFWEAGSLIRKHWLKEYTSKSRGFLEGLEGFDHGSMSALDVASSIGFRQLVCSLIDNGYRDEITVRDATNATNRTPLHYAAWFGHADIVEVLLDNGAPVDGSAESGQATPLHLATGKGHVEVMELLIKAKADPNAVCGNFGPVINGAILSGSHKAVELLVEAKAELSLASDEFESPLALATMFPSKSMFDYLIKSFSGSIPDKEYEKAMIRSAEHGNAEIFEELISASTVKYPDEGYKKVLKVAEREYYWEIIRTLLKYRAGLDCVGLFTKAAMGVASQDQILREIWEYTQHSISQQVLDECLYRGNDLEKESTVELLLGFGADPNAPGQEFGNALTAAAFAGSINIIKRLIAAGADVNAPNGWALHAAAGAGHVAVLAELLAHGAEINRVISKDLQATSMMRSGTALRLACEAGKREAVDLLLQQGADPNIGASNGSKGESTYPLIVASQKGEYGIFKSLIQAGATVDVFGGLGCTTPLINAVLSLPMAAVELLLERGANINLPDKSLGDTALITASRRGDVELVSYLLDRGADILQSNSNGENALQAAASAGRETCLTVLVNHTSLLMEKLKRAIDGGNKAVERVVRGEEEDIGIVAKEEMAPGDQHDNDKAPLLAASGEETIKITHAETNKTILGDDDSSKIVVVPDNDDSSKIVAMCDDDMPDYMKDTFADVDDLGIPIALPSLGLPQPFSAPASALPVAEPSHPPPLPPAASPSPAQTQDVAGAPNLIYRPPQDIRSWTPDSAQFHGQSTSTASSRSSSPVITVITRKKPLPHPRKGTVTTPIMSGSSGTTPALAHTPKSSVEQQGPGRIQLTDYPVPVSSQPLLSDSPRPIQSPFVTAAAARSPSPPKQKMREQGPAPRQDTSSSVTQPPAYAALVAANFRSQSQPQPGSHAIHRHAQPGHSASSSYSLRSLYSVPPTSSAPVSPALGGSAEKAPSLVSHSSSPSISTLASISAQQQQRDVFKQNVEAIPSSRERVEEWPPRHLPHKHSLPSLSSAGWTLQAGSETAEQPVTSADLSSKSLNLRRESKRISNAHDQIPIQLQSQVKGTPPSLPRISSPPANYDGEGWGDSPVEHG